MPGRFQGLNTGVMLCDLDKIRGSSLYKHYLTAAGVTEMIETFRFDKTHLADDWATLLGMAAPELVYPLSCMFNRQIGVPFHPDILEEWRDIFMDFHSCEDFGQEAYILHGNGGESILRYNAMKESINIFNEVDIS